MPAAQLLNLIARPSVFIRRSWLPALIPRLIQVVPITQPYLLVLIIPNTQLVIIQQTQLRALTPVGDHHVPVTLRITPVLTPAPDK